MGRRRRRDTPHGHGSCVPRLPPSAPDAGASAARAQPAGRAGWEPLGPPLGPPESWGPLGAAPSRFCSQGPQQAVITLCLRTWLPRDKRIIRSLLGCCKMKVRISQGRGSRASAPSRMRTKGGDVTYVLYFQFSGQANRKEGYEGSGRGCPGVCIPQASCSHAHGPGHKTWVEDVRT